MKRSETGLQAIFHKEVTGRLAPEEDERERQRLRKMIARIKDGSFARDWAQEQAAGTPVWKQVDQENKERPMIAIEERLRKEMGVLEREAGSR